MEDKPLDQKSPLAPRLILIEPSIEGHTGHHLEYAVHVLRAAAEAGYEPLLATNRRFPADSDAPLVIYRQYKYSFWSQPLVSGLGPMKWLYRKLRRMSTASGATSSGATGVSPVPDTKHRQDASATQHWLRRLAGCWRWCLADPLRVRQFACDTQSLIRQIGLRADDVFFLPGAGEIELEGLARLFARREDAVQATWHLLFRRDPPSPDAASGAHSRLVRALHRIGPAYRAGCVRFYTDTDDLSREYEKLSCPQCRTTFQVVPESGPVENQPYDSPHFRTLPIPHTDGGYVEPRVEETGAGTSPNTTTIAALPLGSEPVPVSRRPLHVLYLGDARREKGYHHLPQIVAQLWDDCIAVGRIRMTIQSNPALTDDEPSIAAARQRLRSCAGSAIALVDEPLSSPAYRRLLHSGDLILLPYDRQAYRWRSSGILVEALAAGIPVIVPADTWLARQLLVDAGNTLLGATGVSPVPGSIGTSPSTGGTPVAPGIAYNDVREIPDLIRQIAAEYDRYRQTALAFAPAWQAKHNATNLIAMLATAIEARRASEGRN